MKHLLFIFSLLALTACSSLPKVVQLPEQHQPIRLFKVEQLSQTQQVQQATLLTLQSEPNQWRWVQTDPLGSPIARVLLSTQGWQNDGFVMPNKQAIQLFSALATKLNENRPLFSFSQIATKGQSKIYFINAQEVWRITKHQQQIKIQLADGSQWNIEELEP